MTNEQSFLKKNLLISIIGCIAIFLCFQAAQLNREVNLLGLRLEAAKEQATLDKKTQDLHLEIMRRCGIKLGGDPNDNESLIVIQANNCSFGADTKFVYTASKQWVVVAK